jgi:acetyl esterase/lipase
MLRTAFALVCAGPWLWTQTMTTQDILKLKAAPGQRIAYGGDPLQFGELRLPAGRGKHPVAVIIHGGCWQAAYDLEHIGTFSAALAQAGIATWTLEYRRIGNPGGGWPGTFQDVGRGVDYLRDLAATHPLDLGRVVVMGHSAGGHLALWVAARKRLPKDSPVAAANPLPLRGAIALAGVLDLRQGAAQHVCGNAVEELMGGPPAQRAALYSQASPAEMLPLGVPQVLLHGALDRIVPVELSKDYADRARKAGDNARLQILPDAGHFELIAPHTSAWPAVLEAVQALLRN